MVYETQLGVYTIEKIGETAEFLLNNVISLRLQRDEINLFITSFGNAFGIDLGIYWI